MRSAVMAVGCVRLSSSNILTYLTIITCFILFNCWIYDNTILEYPVRYNSIKFVIITDDKGFNYRSKTWTRQIISASKNTTLD